jgi:osmotically-inducible protein OsmY
MTNDTTDIQLQEQVLNELKWDARVDPADVGVTVDDGVVTLAGTVGSYAERMAANEAAHRVRGVRDVANELEVRLPDILQRTDTEIARAVRWALEWDVLVPDERIQSSVSNGWVTLEGTVDKPTQREDAERAVRNLAGVRGVTNDITNLGATPGAAHTNAPVGHALSAAGPRGVPPAEYSGLRLVEHVATAALRIHFG